MNRRDMFWVTLALAVLVASGQCFAQTVECDGTACGGAGTVSCDTQLRDYVYRVTIPDADTCYVLFVGTHDGDPSHYTDICMPQGWTFSIVPDALDDFSAATGHGLISPGPDGSCEFVIKFWNVGGQPFGPKADFAFNHFAGPHDVSWQLEWSFANLAQVDWNAAVGQGTGPVHGPKPLPSEACCLPYGTCQTMPPGACELAGGTPLGTSPCLGDNNGNGIDDACECTPAPSGMSNWWTFDEPAGPFAHDQAGQNNIGTHLGGPVPVPGKFAGALLFDGVDDYVNVPDNWSALNGDELNLGTGSFSIDAWIKVVDPTGLCPIVDKRRGWIPIGYTLYLRAGRLGFQMADGAGTYGFTNYETGVLTWDPNLWYHVAVTVNRTSGTPEGFLYVNGTPQVISVYGTLTFPPRLGSLSNTVDLWIGRHSNSVGIIGQVWWLGTIDEVEIFHRALSPGEIQTIYSAPGGKCKRPTGNILVCKFHDIDTDGTWDPTEPGIPGVTVTVNGARAITNADGCYTYEYVPIGTYPVSENVPAGWYQTSPTPFLLHQAIVTANATSVFNDFGNAQLPGPHPSGGDITVSAGDDDQFNHNGSCEESALPGPALQTVLDTCSGGPVVCTCPPGPEFDCPAIGQCFGHTFSDFLVTDCLVRTAQITGRFKATGTSPSTDVLHLLQGGTDVWRISLNSLSEIANNDSTWDLDDTLTISLALDSLPASGVGPSNILLALQDGDLDVMIEDDTEVDYLELTVESACDCPFQDDFDEDGFVTALDLAALIDILFAGDPDIKDPCCPVPRGDDDCDGFTTAIDLSIKIDYLFAGGAAPCDPCAP